MISYVAEEQLRRVVMGYSDADPTPEQMARMEALPARSMREGAGGLVTLYDSGGPPHPDEAIALAKVAAQYGSNYTTQIGGEGYQEEKELNFAIRVGREAHILGLPDRGQLKVGYWADVTLFDPDTVAPTNSYEHPQSYVKGIPYVIVNGVTVVDKGKHAGARPGVPILGHGAKGKS